MLLASVVATDWAISRPPESRMAAEASEPSTMNVE